MATDVTTTGTAAPLDPSQSTLSVNFAPYVYDMLAKGQAAANLDYLPYTGQRYAGPSALESQAFKGLGALGQYSPTSFSSGYTAPALSGATQFGNQFTAPGAYNPTQFSTGYTAPTLSSATRFTNQFTAPGAYNAAQFSTGLGAVGSVQDYMSPYLSNVMDIEAREARREADISRQADQGRLARAGAYGGSRQAIMDAERQRNLATQVGDIRSKGLQSAFQTALKQRLDEATLGLDAQKGTESSRQFGATQAMTSAENRAKYGLDALREAESARQFQEKQRQAAAEFGATQGLEAQRLGEASRQFGAKYGLDALRDQMSAGERQRAIEQAPLDFKYQQYQEQMKYPYEQATYMKSLLGGLPLQAPEYQPEQSALLAMLQGLFGTKMIAGN